MKFIVNSRLFLLSVFEMRIPSSLQHPEVSSSFYFKLLAHVLTVHTGNALTWGNWWILPATVALPPLRLNLRWACAEMVVIWSYR